MNPIYRSTYSQPTESHSRMALLAIGSISIHNGRTEPMLESMGEQTTEQTTTSKMEPSLLEKTRINAEGEPSREFNADQKEKKIKPPSAKDIGFLAAGLGVGLVANEVRKRTK